MIEAINYSRLNIEKTLESFTEAWNVHDAPALSKLFTEDADFTNVFGQSFSGRRDIQAQHAPIFEGIFKSSELIFTKIQTRFFNYDIAAVDVHWNMNGPKDFNDNEWADRKGLMSLVMKRESDTWLIAVMHNMELSSPAFNKVSLS